MVSVSRVRLQNHRRHNSFCHATQLRVKKRKFHLIIVFWNFKLQKITLFGKCQNYLPTRKSVFSEIPAAHPVHDRFGSRTEKSVWSWCACLRHYIMRVPRKCDRNEDSRIIAVSFFRTSFHLTSRVALKKIEFFYQYSTSNVNHMNKQTTNVFFFLFYSNHQVTMKSNTIDQEKPIDNTRKRCGV